MKKNKLCMGIISVALMLLFIGCASTGSGPVLKDDDPAPLVAAYGSSADIRSMLDEGLDPNSRDRNKITLLMHAVLRNEDPEAVKILLDAGASVNDKNKNGWTALHYAAFQNGNPQVFQYLIGAGADALIEDKDGQTPLRMALGRRNYNGIIELTRAGEGLSIQDKNGSLPLHTAVRFRDLQAAYILLAAGADVNQKESGGNTPLLVAVIASRYENYGMIDLLLDAGADPNIESDSGTKVITSARRSPGLQNTATLQRLEMLSR